MAAMNRTLPAVMRPADLVRISSIGIRTRKLRAGLSALGIAIGVAAIVAVLGLSSSSQAGLLADIDRLGTNLLTVTNGQTGIRPTCRTADLCARDDRSPRAGHRRRTDRPGQNVVNAYRSQLVPKINTNSLPVQAASLGLLAALKTTVAHGNYLNAATAAQPVAVLGAVAASWLPEPKTVKNRIHLDLGPTDRTRDEEVARLCALGASAIADYHTAERLVGSVPALVTCRCVAGEVSARRQAVDARRVTHVPVLVVVRGRLLELVQVEDVAVLDVCHARHRVAARVGDAAYVDDDHRPLGMGASLWKLRA
jgi:MacB-like periplasmic core domain/Glyoxalase-like domain